MIQLEELRNALKAADARLAELQLARNKFEDTHTKAEEALSQVTRLAIAMVKSRQDEAQGTAVPRPHVAGLFRSVASPQPPISYNTEHYESLARR